MSSRLAESGLRAINFSSYVNQSDIVRGYDSSGVVAEADASVLSFLMSVVVSRPGTRGLFGTGGEAMHEWQAEIVPLLLQDPIAVASVRAMAVLHQAEPGEVQATVEHDILRRRWCISLGLFYRDDQYMKLKATPPVTKNQSVPAVAAEAPKRRLRLPTLKSISPDEEGTRPDYT